MEATELRISNIVNCNNKRHHEPYIVVESITSECINVDFRPYNLNELEPIPLTEDWLLKLGFKKDLNSYKLKNFGRSMFHFGKPCFYPAGRLSSLMRMDNLSYVHQLQNLYFALTGEELKII